MNPNSFLDFPRQFPLLLRHLHSDQIACASAWAPTLVESFREMEGVLASGLATDFERHSHKPERGQYESHRIDQLWVLHEAQVWVRVPFLTAIKEKFGSLRIFGTGFDHPHLLGLIQKAEKSVTQVCDVCGSKGENGVYDGVVAVRCKKHRKNAF